MNKAEVRRTYRTRRQGLTSEAIRLLNRQLTDRFFDFLQTPTLPPTAVVHTFLPIRRLHEVDTWPIIHRLWANYPTVQLVSSVTDAATQTLTHFRLNPNTRLHENDWGIPEPLSPIDTIKPQRIDRVLVPLLAVDTYGHRVGYGGGYYDRFLAECRPDCLKIGLGFFEPIDRIDDVQPTDVRLDAYITPDSVWSFSRG